jgi:hypothetical protein
MSNSKHTPGPWRVDPDHCRDVQTADGAIEICLAEGGKPYGQNSFSVPPVEESHANARLIAAAPDLLETLKLLHLHLTTPIAIQVSRADLVNKAKTAIAKAEGMDKATGETK